MKTIQEIRDEVAKEIGFKNWVNMIHIYDGVTTSVTDAVAKRYAEEALKEAHSRIMSGENRFIINQIVKGLK